MFVARTADVSGPYISEDEGFGFRAERYTFSFAIDWKGRLDVWGVWVMLSNFLTQVYIP